MAVGLEYDGSAYAGWQTQVNATAVQSIVERALSRVANEPVAVSCAGRTDAGVHALTQVIHFDTSATRPLRGWMLGTNADLPDDIAVRWVLPVAPHFHARYSALSRTYCYVILNRSARTALGAKRVAWVPRPLDAASMSQATAHLVGEHDFSAFRAAECQAKSPVRELHELRVQRVGDYIAITVTANAFLHHMVRNLAGLLIRIGQGDAPPEHAAAVLASRDRRQSGVTAPAAGLYFQRVRYPAEFGLPQEDSAMILDLPSQSV